MESYQNIKNERILFSPLNWGWGHVSRSIPMLQILIENKNHVTIACTDEHKTIYEEYLENVDFILWEGYPFRFRGKGNFGLDLFLSLRELRRFGKKEQSNLETLQTEKNFTLVLSENRYFFRSVSVKSIFITHQVSLPLPWYLSVVQRIHCGLINKFDAVWIVDDEAVRLAGKLSEKVHSIKIPAHYIGFLSRLKNGNKESLKKGELALVSGPEPYAKQFYLAQKKNIINEEKTIIYNGRMETKDGSKNISWKEIDEQLIGARKLISRSGYSTLMDAYYLKCETEWHSTPGQWEQEYLAEIHLKSRS